MIPVIDPTIGKVGTVVIAILITNPVGEQENPGGSVHKIVPNVN